MKEIMIVSRNQNLVVLSMKSNLEKRGYDLGLCEYVLEKMPKVSDATAAIIVNVDDESSENRKELVYLRDQAIEHDLKIYLIGIQEDIESLGDIIPQHVIEEVILRPVNVAEVCERIDKHVKYRESNDKKTILVVDDSGQMLLAIKSWLEEEYKVIMANSGTMAIKYLTMNHPDLVLLDYEMPIVSGKQVLEMIRSEEDFRSTPVIFLTSKNDKESVMQVMSLKPEGYLLKTMSPDTIRKEIKEFFERRKAL